MRHLRLNGKPNVGSMLAQRLRRWPNIDPALTQCLLGCHVSWGGSCRRYKMSGFSARCRCQYEHSRQCPAATQQTQNILYNIYTMLDQRRRLRADVVSI